MRVREKGPGEGWLSARVVEGRRLTPICRGTRGAAGCRTPGVVQALDGGHLAINGHGYGGKCCSRYFLKLFVHLNQTNRKLAKI